MLCVCQNPQNEPPKVKPMVNYGLWVIMMCHWRFTNYTNVLKKLWSRGTYGNFIFCSMLLLIYIFCLTKRNEILINTPTMMNLKCKRPGEKKWDSEVSYWRTGFMRNILILRLGKGLTTWNMRNYWNSSIFLFCC